MWEQEAPLASTVRQVRLGGHVMKCDDSLRKQVKTRFYTLTNSKGTILAEDTTSPNLVEREASSWLHAQAKNCALCSSCFEARDDLRNWNTIRAEKKNPLKRQLLLRYRVQLGEEEKTYEYAYTLLHSPARHSLDPASRLFILLSPKGEIVKIGWKIWNEKLDYWVQ